MMNHQIFYTVIFCDEIYHFFSLFTARKLLKELQIKGIHYQIRKTDFYWSHDEISQKRRKACRHPQPCA